MSTAERNWGVRLTDRICQAVHNGQWEESERLLTEGDGETRSLGTEYTFMLRGLGFTLSCLIRLLEASPCRQSPGGVSDLEVLMNRLRDAISHLEGAEAATRVEDRLANAVAEAEAKQAELARAVGAAVHARDTLRTLNALDDKERAYLDLHDPLIRFMADSFAWVLRHGGTTELLRFHLATAEAQRAGFEKWEGLDASEFARVTAFLLKQHMGQVEVAEDERRFTIKQSPCGSGGRLRLSGAYRGEQALPLVTEPGPLTFGHAQMPVYCTHCAIWNGTAPLQWFGRAQWVFDEPARADGSCTLHIYKDTTYTPPEYVSMVAVPTRDDGA